MTRTTRLTSERGCSAIKWYVRGSPNALEMRSFLPQLEYRICQINLRMRLIGMQPEREIADRPRNENVPA